MKKPFFHSVVTEEIFTVDNIEKLLLFESYKNKLIAYLLDDEDADKKTHRMDEKNYIVNEKILIEIKKIKREIENINLAIENEEF